MSDGQPHLDFRGKFFRLAGYAFVAAALAAVAWGIVTVGTRLFGEAQHLRCQHNLQQLAGAIRYYRNNHRGLPPYLAALTEIVDRQAVFVCPADARQGAEGCRPEWLQRYDRLCDEQEGAEGFRYVDLDGPTLTEADEDWLPSSYLYTANGYPCGFARPPFSETWRTVFNRTVEEHGQGVPVVRCFYHVSEEYVPLAEGAEPAPGGPPPIRVPLPTAEFTLNITADLETVVRYPYSWQEADEFSDGP
ncbi:MAG: hypothetical protein ACOC8E_06415 [Planctomycetota bacterium]